MIDFGFMQINNVLEGVIVLILTVSFTIQMYYYLCVFKRAISKKQKFPQVREPVSVILYVQNEDDNLEQLLSSVMGQNYPEYEVIVVIYDSSDDTEDILKRAHEHYPRLQVRSLDSRGDFTHEKNVVLGVGLKAAKYDRIVFTKAYCRFSPDWLESLSKGFGADLTLSYSRYSGKNKKIRAFNYFESLFMLGYARKGQPRIGSVENAGFRKSLFFDSTINYVAKNQDKTEQLFLRAKTNGYTVSVVVTPDAINTYNVYYPFDKWLQKRKFRKGAQQLKQPERLSRVCFFASVVFAALLFRHSPYILLGIAGIFIIRQTVQIIIFHATQKALGERHLLARTLMRDILLK
jgi:cellulose synthase/poly-beta-1,6-N-acetylglucosamine synthase-like glycosyltransferase